MTKLSVNLNKIALLRNTRKTGKPSVTRAAQICIDAGTHGITVHPRPDQRHILPTDVYNLANKHSVEFNIEGNPFYPHFMDMIRKVKPTQCSLVPDDADAFTTEHGWDIAENCKRLRPIIQEMQDLGIRVCLFMDPDTDQIQRVNETGADRIEVNTTHYAASYNSSEVELVFRKYVEAAETAQKSGIGVNAGHDLSLENLHRFCAIPGILEVSIGHALTAEAIMGNGLAQAVKDYLAVLHSTE